jgi:hypothetical protein
MTICHNKTSIRFHADLPTTPAFVTLKMWPNENLLPNQEVVQTKMPKNKRGSAYNISSSTMQPIDQTPKL